MNVWKHLIMPYQMEWLINQRERIDEAVWETMIIWMSQSVRDKAHLKTNLYLLVFLTPNYNDRNFKEYVSYSCQNVLLGICKRIKLSRQSSVFYLLFTFISVARWELSLAAESASASSISQISYFISQILYLEFQNFTLNFQDFIFSFLNFILKL